MGAHILLVQIVTVIAGRQRYRQSLAHVQKGFVYVFLDVDAVVLYLEVKVVFAEYVEEHGLAEIAEIFRGGVRVEVGDMLPSSQYADRLQAVPPAWNKAFEVNASENEAVRASCVEFVLAGLYSMDRISRSQRHGKIEYEL